MKRSLSMLATLLLLVAGAREGTAGLFVPGSSFTVIVNNDPLGNSFTGTVPLSGGPTTVDQGLLTVSETITPVNTSTAWIEFDFNATGNVLVGDPSSYWRIAGSNIQTTGPTALTEGFTFFDVNGVSTPFPFSGSTITTNPLTGVGNVALGISQPPFTYSTTQSVYAQMDPFNQGPTLFGTNPSNTPSGFSIAVEYQLKPEISAAPEPSSLALCTAGLLGLVSGGWWRRKQQGKNVITKVAE